MIIVDLDKFVEFLPPISELIALADGEAAACIDIYSCVQIELLTNTIPNKRFIKCTCFKYFLVPVIMVFSS